MTTKRVLAIHILFRDDNASDPKVLDNIVSAVEHTIEAHLEELNLVAQHVAWGELGDWLF